MSEDVSLANKVSLTEHLDDVLKKVHTQSLDLSFNELLDMYEQKELDIAPDYQRLFQWSEAARSRFIESLLLEMPVPPIYVVEDTDGKYSLIDGLQRFSSYLHLRGKLDATHLDPPVKAGDKLTLVDCDIVKALNGLTFDDLDLALQIKLKRSFIRVEVVRKGSDNRFKYWMFKRLNTGGELLSEQQIRNCSIRLLNNEFITFIKELAQNEFYKVCTETLTDEKRLQAFDEELILRFFAMKNNRISFKHDIRDFLTEYMESVSDPEKPLPFDYQSEKDAFIKTFSILTATLGPLSFGFPNKIGNKITSGFSVLHYEAITLGLQPMLKQLAPDDNEQMNRLSALLMQIKLDETFIRHTTGGGKNSKGLLEKRVSYVAEKLADFE